MSDQFMQEVQEEEHSIEDLERKISQEPASARQRQMT